MIVLYGSGGHAKVVLECLASENKEVIGFFDDRLQLGEFKGIPILGAYTATLFPEAKLIITIGNNSIRKKISTSIRHGLGFTANVQSIVSPSSQIGEGTVVMPRAVVQSDVTIGKHVIINTGAIIEHDCQLEDFVHVAPGAVLCGGVHIGEGTLIGANAVVIPYVKVGKWCQIGAGCSILENVPDGSIVMAAPGKIVNVLSTEKN